MSDQYSLIAFPSRTDEDKRNFMKEFFVCFVEKTTIDDQHNECSCRPTTDACPLHCETTSTNGNVMVVGLRVNPRREEHRNNYKTLPSIKFCEGMDIVSRKAYNKAIVDKGVASTDRDSDFSFTVLDGSLDGSIINAPFVLYISAEHWNIAKKYVPSLYSIIVTSVNNKFEPSQVLKVTPYLMDQVLLSFVRSSQSSELKRPLSQRAIFIYYQVFRVFYELSSMYPEVFYEATNILGRFISDPQARNAIQVPYLDALLPIMSIASNISWDEFKQPFLQEFWRRAAFKYPYERGADSEVLDMQARVRHLFHQHKNKCKSVALAKCFLDKMLRPDGALLADVIVKYDQVLGYIEDEVVDSILNTYHEQIESMDSMEKFMDFMGFTSTRKELEEMVDWAYQYANFETMHRNIHNSCDTTLVPSNVPTIEYRTIKTAEHKESEREDHKGIPKNMFNNTCGYCMQKFKSRTEVFLHLNDMGIDCSPDPIFKAKNFAECTGNCQHGDICKCHFVLRDVPLETVDEEALLKAQKIFLPKKKKQPQVKVKKAPVVDNSGIKGRDRVYIRKKAHENHSHDAVSSKSSSGKTISSKDLDGNENDLVEDGMMNGCRVLIGDLCFGHGAKAIVDIPGGAGKALSAKGFSWDLVCDEQKFLDMLDTDNYDVAWIISFQKAGVVKDFAKRVRRHHEAGKGLMIFNDDDAHPDSVSNLVLKDLFGKDYRLTGNTPATKRLTPHPHGTVPGTFKREHPVTDGILELYEGVTICYPTISHPEVHVLATSSNDHPCILYYDHGTRGRVIIDSGFTKLHNMHGYWDSIGTGRYVRNAGCWLTGARFLDTEELIRLQMLV
jgi:hypothetical protein